MKAYRRSVARDCIYRALSVQSEVDENDLLPRPIPPSLAWHVMFNRNDNSGVYGADKSRQTSNFQFLLLHIISVMQTNSLYLQVPTDERRNKLQWSQECNLFTKIGADLKHASSLNTHRWSEHVDACFFTLNIVVTYI